MRRDLSLSLFWFLYFAAIGAFFPFFSLYLKENAGLDGTRLALVQIAFPLVALFAQPFWGQVADRTGARSRVLCALTAAAAVGFAAMYFAVGFSRLLLTAAGLAVFMTVVIPMAVSVSMESLRDVGAAAAFGRVRVWGTIGFLGSVVGFPPLLERYQGQRGLVAAPDGPSEPGLELLFLFAAGFAAAAALAGLALPRTDGAALRAGRGDWKLLFRHRPVVRLLGFAVASFFCLQGPIVLFPLYVRSIGGDIDLVGRMWLMMLLVEIPLVAWSGQGLRRLGARGLLLLGVVCGGARWLVCAATADLRILYPAQLAHGVTVTGLLLGGPMYLEEVVPERLRSTAQALYSMAGIGVGGSLSIVASGELMDRFGVDAVYLLGGAGAVLVGAAVPWLLPPPRHLEQAEPPANRPC